MASVIGFPFGATPSDVKAFETRRAVRDGANEIDMVINIGAVSYTHLRAHETERTIAYAVVCVK